MTARTPKCGSPSSGLQSTVRHSRAFAQRRARTCSDASSGEIVCYSRALCSCCAPQTGAYASCSLAFNHHRRRTDCPWTALSRALPARSDGAFDSARCVQCGRRRSPRAHAVRTHKRRPTRSRSHTASTATNRSNSAANTTETLWRPASVSGMAVAPGEWHGVGEHRLYCTPSGRFTRPWVTPHGEIFRRSRAVSVYTPGSHSTPFHAL